MSLIFLVGVIAIIYVIGSAIIGLIGRASSLTEQGCGCIFSVVIMVVLLKLIFGGVF